MILLASLTSFSNGAVTFLFWGGLVTLVANVLGLLGGCSRQLALR